MAVPAVLPDTADFLASKHLMLIGGKWVAAASGDTIPVINPATEEVIASVPAGAAADIALAVAAARKAFDSGPWPKMPPSERAKLL